MVAPHATPDWEMAKLHEQGARALRFILAHPGGLPVGDLERSWDLAMAAWVAIWYRAFKRDLEMAR